MSKPEWTKIGNVEVCVGTDGVTGVYVNDYAGVVRVNNDGTTMYSVKSKEMFESKHCQPQKPRHIRTDYADGSVVVDSVEQDEQGRPLRVAFIPDINGEPLFQVRFLLRVEIAESADAIVARAVRYVETGE